MFENLTSDRRELTPSLNALRAFEAVARTGKVVLAAEELCVTHSAVSRQVKALEAGLGAALFSGPKHALQLTPVGHDLLAGLTPAFDMIANAALAARSRADDLVLAVNASISVKWLIPRLSRFAAARPNVKLQLVELASTAFSHRGAHAVMRIANPDRLAAPGVTAFMPNAIGPVIAPGLLARTGDLLAAPRLASSSHAHGWAEWAGLAGATLSPAHERSFAHLHFTLDAAIAGLGAAVLPWALVCDDVAAGRLAAPLGFRRAQGSFAVLPTPGVSSRALTQFTAWLQEEGARASKPPSPSVTAR